MSSMRGPLGQELYCVAPWVNSCIGTRWPPPRCCLLVFCWQGLECQVVGSSIVTVPSWSQWRGGTTALGGWRLGAGARLEMQGGEAAPHVQGPAKVVQGGPGGLLPGSLPDLASSCVHQIALGAGPCPAVSQVPLVDSRSRGRLT